MNKIVKLRHIAVIVSVLIIVIGMAVGTICHFISNGFFNYGGEFASYKSVEVTTSVVEDTSGDAAKQIASDALSSLGAYEVTFSQATGYVPNTVVYKFYNSVSDQSIANAVQAVKDAFSEKGMEDGTVASFVNDGYAEGIFQLNFAAIALASAVVFQAIYFAVRYKPGMALSALCSQLVVVGVYASLLAITRCPVGLEAIAFAALAVIVTMICNGISFDRIKKSYKDEANAKADRLDLISEGVGATAKLNAFVCAAVAVIAVVFAIFAFIASPTAATLLPFAVCLLSVVSCAFTFGVFTPSSYALMSGMDRRNNN